MKPADLTRLSLALLALGTVFPLAADEQRSRAPGPTSEAAAKLDLNTADRKTLEALTGPDVARAIIAARPFTSLNDLDRVKGLNTEQLELLRARSHVSAPPARQRLGEPAVASGNAPAKKPLGAPAAAATTPTETAKLDLNTASAEALAASPAIGPELARKIVAARPFASINDLNRLKDISTEQLEQVRAAVTVSAR